MAKNTEVKTSVSPSLHPANITGIKGYDEHKGYCGDAESAFNAAYKSVEDVINARHTIKQDESRTPKAKALLLADKAEKYLTALQKRFGGSWDRIDAGMKHIEKQLSEPLEQLATAGIVNGEIRAHAKSLKPDARRKLITDALEKGDAKTLGAILGAPEYLSGLSSEEKTHYTQMYRKAVAPELVSRLEVLKQVKQKLELSANIIKMEMEKAIGLSPVELQRLREGSKAAEDALIVKEFASA